MNQEGFLTFEQWRSQPAVDWPYLRHAMAVDNPKALPDCLWRAVFQYCTQHVGVFLFRLTESQKQAWNPKTAKVLYQLNDCNYKLGVGLKVDTTPRPRSQRHYAGYLLYLIQLLEQERIQSSITRSKLECQLDLATKKLHLLGYAYCDHRTCGAWKHMPHGHDEEDE